MELVRNFTKLGKNDAPIAGGKGASLGEMTQAGIPVPPGFVVLAESFEQFIKETDLVQEIDAILHKVNHQEIHTVESASEAIRALILSADMPTDIATEIDRSFKELNTKYVAVRSSATAEDGKDHAWAGQLESYLNTIEDDVLTKVKLCWSSLFTPRAIFYRFEKGLHSTKISVAVVVQKMVESEVSGIAFSVHPVTEDYNQLIIEAGFGLGEAIVSGSVTPDSYVVEKEPRNILDINIATQNRGLYRSEKSSVEHGNNEWLDIPEPKASTQVLTKEQILELSEIILNIENHYGFPCDIEWAFEKEKFYVVQSRPITTLSQKSSGSINNATQLSKIYSREKALFYFCIWQSSDIQGVKDYIGANIKSGVFIVRPKGQSGEVWYSASELAELTKSSIATINSDSAVREKMIRNIEGAWESLQPYFEDGKEITNVDNMLEYYQHLVDFWSSINTIFFELPNLEEVNADFRKKVLAMRTVTEKYTDQMSTKFVVWFEKTFPTLKHLAYFITPQETKRLVDNPEDADLVALLEERAKAGCFMLSGQVYLIADLNHLLKENNFALEQIKVDSANEIKGSVAYPGKVTGTVKVVISKADIQKVGAGDILVSPMTNPEFVPYMQKAAAFVTDEGGITCHAAIVSREMKKPCVIGTKIATQVLKDGDLVEVDADNGVVRIIKDDQYSPIDFKKRKWVVYGAAGWPAFITPFAVVPSREFAKRYGITNEVIALWKGKTFDWLFAENELVDFAKAFLPQIIEKQWSLYDEWQILAKKFDDLHYELFDIDVSTLSDKKLADWTKKYYEAFIEQYAVNNFIEPLSFYFQNHLKVLLAGTGIEEKEADKLSGIYGAPAKPNYIKQCVEEYKNIKGKSGVEDLLKKYHFINNDYTGTRNVTKDDIKELVQNHSHPISEVKDDESIPQEARDLLTVLQITATIQDVRKAESLMWVTGAEKLIRELAQRKNVSVDDLLNATWDEIIEGTINQNELNERRGHCVIDWQSDGVYVYIGDKATSIEADFKRAILGDAGDAKEFTGFSASAGKVTGRAVVVLNMSQFHKVKKGDILVTVMTRPEYLPVMQVASAFVTDEGGITSHAAIVAREMNKPCVIGTKIASKIIKDGDMVEVDADNGMVRIVR